MYQDFWENKDRFDYSEYNENSQHFDKTNKKVIRKFKDEACGIPIVNSLDKYQRCTHIQMYFLALRNARCFSALHTDVLVFVA